MRILTWNLFHGRSVPAAGRPLPGEFAQMLAGWDWDAALLQEVPPWFPGELARRANALAFTALTSRNQLLPLRRAVGRHWPDLAKSSGGANAILVRGHGVTAHHRRRVRLRPERRVFHAVRRDDGLWLGNLHATAWDVERAQSDLNEAAAAMLRWAGDEPAVIGADCNTKTPSFPGFTHCGGHVLDHVFARGLRVAEPARTLPRHCKAIGANLSDHKPVLVGLEALTPRA